MSSQAFAENFGRCRTASRVRRSVSVPCAVTLATSLDVSPRTSASTARNSFLSFELAPLCERHHSVPSITVSHRQPYQVLRRRRRVLAGLVRRPVPVAAFLREGRWQWQ